MTAEEDSAAPSSAMARSSPALRPGACLGRYLIDKRVGWGAMSAVYRARRLPDQQLYAIKVLHNSLAQNVVQITRFLGEASTLWMLRHPHIIRAYEAISASPPYFVMDWVDGKTLRHMLTEQRTLPASSAARIALQLANALSYVYTSAGLIHRDIKPENLMITDSGHLKLLDFGLAHTYRRSVTRLGISPEIAGSPAYMAPEIYNGIVDARTDVYAAGICLYEMIVGLLPESDAAANTICLQECIPPSLAELILRAIAPDPAQRYPTATALAADLTAWLESSANTPR